MESATDRTAASEGELKTLPAELPLLACLALAPLLGGYMGMPLPTLWLCCLPWLALLLRHVLPGQPPLRAPRASWIVLALPALAALSFITSANRGATVIAFAEFASYAATLWLCADSASRGGAPRLFGALLLGALIAAGMALQEWGLHARTGDLGWRSFGPFTNQNFLAGFLAPALVLTLGLALTQPAGFRSSTWILALGILTAALAGGIMVSGSRGGLVALGGAFVGLAALRALRGPMGDPAGWRRFGALVVVTALVGAALMGAVRNRFTAMTGSGGLPAELCPDTSTSQGGESAKFRIETWKSAARMGLKRPILGWGAGSFETAYAPHAIVDFTRHAHSTYLQLLAEMGLPGVLLWIALLGCALLPLFRVRPGWDWIPAVAMALLVGSIHGVFDSLLYVPAIALFTAALLGVALRPSDELAQRMDAAAAAEAQPLRRKREAAPAAPIPRFPKGVGVGAAALGLALCLFLGYGRSLIGEAAGLRAGRQYAESEAALATAQRLLPWDAEVADGQRETYLYLGRIDDAVTAAQRAINLAPERPPGYFYLGRIREDAQQNYPLAQLQYEQGLKHAPHEMRLLGAEIRVLERQGDRKGALEVYRRIAAIEDSPAGQLRALNELRDYRFGRARLALAQEAAANGQREEALRQLFKAACFLAERRIFFQGYPAVYRVTGDWDLTTERELRQQEAQAWTSLAADWRRKGDRRRADLATEQATNATASLDKLDEIFKQYQ